MNKNSSDMDYDKLEKKLEQYEKDGDYPKLKKELFYLFSVAVNDSSDFELKRLLEWLQEKPRQQANTKFTAGMTRNVAREFEYLLRHSW